MALFKHEQFLTKLNNAAFDKLQSPGMVTTYSGIYRCEGCGHEVTSVHNHTLPPQNHHQHSAAEGTIRWRLVVCTQKRR
jgi:hypothetical protein